MSDFEEESNGCEEYEYSSNMDYDEDEDEIEAGYSYEEDQNYAYDNGESLPEISGNSYSQSSHGQGAFRLTDVKYPTHSYTRQIQSIIGNSLIPDGKCVIVDYWDFLPKISQLANEVSSLLSVNYDVALQLLLYYKFDKEKLLDCYYASDDELKNSSNILVGLGLFPSGDDNDNECKTHYQVDDCDCSSYMASSTAKSLSCRSLATSTTDREEMEGGSKGDAEPTTTCPICYDEAVCKTFLRPDPNGPGNNASFLTTDVPSGASSEPTTIAPPPGTTLEGSFCCCCKHIVCTDCYVNYVCNKLYSEGINCISNSCATTSSGNSSNAAATPSLTCPYYKCNVLLPFSAMVKLLYNNQNPVTIATSFKTKDKKVAPASLDMQSAAVPSTASASKYVQSSKLTVNSIASTVRRAILGDDTAGAGQQQQNHNTSVSTSSATLVASTPTKNQEAKAPSMCYITRPAHFYFNKYVEHLVKFYIQCTRKKLAVGEALSHSSSSSSLGDVGPTIDSIQYCPSPTCDKIVIVGKLVSYNSDTYNDSIMTGGGIHSVTASPEAYFPVMNGSNIISSNPIVPLLYTTNVKCSSCLSSYCLLCQQGGVTPMPPVPMTSSGVCSPSRPPSSCSLSASVPNVNARHPVQQQMHIPASCAQYSKWVEKITNGESDTASWLLVNTKRCPGPLCNGQGGSNSTNSASTRIEKNQGCNHMTCKVCKHEFCWICLEPWKNHNGSYYECNKYKEKEATSGGGVKGTSGEDITSKEEEERMAKRELDRYLHYYARFQSHDLAIKYAATKQRAIVAQKMLELQQTQSQMSSLVCTTKEGGINEAALANANALFSSGQKNPSTPTAYSSSDRMEVDVDVDDGSFMKVAVEQVIQCRTVLKHSYILGYYLTGEISNFGQNSSSSSQASTKQSLETLQAAKDLFEHQQEMLEKNTELLSELTEVYCNNSKGVLFLKEKENTTDSSRINQPSKLKKPDASPVENRNRIINLTRITEKFMNHLLESIGTDGSVSSLLVMTNSNNVYNSSSSSECKSESKGMHLDDDVAWSSDDIEEMAMQEQLLVDAVESSSSIASRVRSRASSGTVEKNQSPSQQSKLTATPGPVVSKRRHK